jgi:RHS repeat-associated protein
MTMIKLIKKMTQGLFRTRRTFSQAIIGILLFASGQAFAAQSVTFYHNDLLGSPVAVTDIKGDLCWRENYRPYGGKILNNDAAQSANPLCGLDDNQRGYTNHVHDKDIGLTYMQARFYDPAIGRFMGIDPIGPRLSEQVSFNRYAYGNNNPYKYSDPDGKAAQGLLGLGLGIAVATGAVSLSTATAVAKSIAFATVIGIAFKLADKMFSEESDTDKDESEKSKRFSKEKEDLVDMADQDKKSGGVTQEDMDAYSDLNDGLSDPFAEGQVRGLESHPGKKHGAKPHGHVGPVGHIPGKDVSDSGSDNSSSTTSDGDASLGY